MFQQSKDMGSFSEIPTKEASWRAKLKLKKSSTAVVKWPNPQQSVGTLRYNDGKRSFWEVKDPGRKELAPLEVEVQQLLNTHNEHFKEREASNLSFSIFMVGRNETTSSPTLVIISANKRSRQKVVDTILSSKILDKYEGVLLGQYSKHSRHPQSGPAECIAFNEEDWISNLFSGPRVYIKKRSSQVKSGTSIYIPTDDFIEGGQ
jgi:hypothetical protein